MKVGPIGKGFVQEVKTKRHGTRFVARWNAYEEAPDGSIRRVQCGPHELGSKVAHGPGLKNVKDAQKAWDVVYREVFKEHHPDAYSAVSVAGVKASAKMTVADFIKAVWEPERAWEDNSRLNWEYYRDSFLLPFFGEITIAEMNDKERIKAFMKGIAEREFSDWTARKAFSYAKSILDTSANMGVTRGNAARLIPAKQRIPKGVKRAHSQPHIDTDQFVALLQKIERPRDRIIVKILFLCAVRRSEFLVLKWKDFSGDTLRIQRSFDSRMHQVKEWNPDLKAHGKVAVPPALKADLEGWRKFGDTKDEPEGYIFPTRNGSCLIPTNWIEDVLKPAAARAGIAVIPAEGEGKASSEIAPHWFRRGHATAQNVETEQVDKNIQGQMRHSRVEITQNIYAQNVPKAQRMAVEELESVVMAKLNAG